VETLQPCQLAFIPRDEFLKFIKEHSDALISGSANTWAATARWL